MRRPSWNWSAGRICGPGAASWTCPFLRDKLRDDPPPVDYLLIDCPPSLGILTLNALAAVSEVFIPLQPHFFALHGLSKLLETIDLVAERLNDQLKLSGVILCMYDAGTRLAAEVSQDVDEFFRNARGQPTPWAAAQIFQTRIRRNVRLAEAPSFGKSIFQYAPDSHGAEDYRRLAEEIQRRTKGEGLFSLRIAGNNRGDRRKNPAGLFIALWSFECDARTFTDLPCEPLEVCIGFWNGVGVRLYGPVRWLEKNIGLRASWAMGIRLR